jgi:tetratricopeptide (TPR) repeat protein
MKPKFYTLIVLIAATALLFSCKSASKLYKQGNYDEAVEAAVKKLQKKPGDAEMKALIQSAYQYAVTDHEKRIADYSANSSDLKYEWVYNEYADLQNLYNAIYRAPEVYELVKPADYSFLVISYREKAGDAHIARGLTWMKQPDRESAKKAYREFQTALNFIPGDIKIQQLLTDSYDAAVTRVVITQIGNYDFQYSSYNSSPQNSGDEIIRNLVYNSGNEFVKFYSVPDARSRHIEPGQVIELHLNDINIGRIQENWYTQEVTKDAVIKEIVFKPDSTVKVYGKVKAKITTVKRTLVSRGNLSIIIRDHNGHAIWNDNVYGENRWATEFSTYTGDERALSDEDKHLINRRPDNIPGERSIIDCITQEVFNNASYRIRNYYSRY